MDQLYFMFFRKCLHRLNFDDDAIGDHLISIIFAHAMTPIVHGNRCLLPHRQSCLEQFQPQGVLTYVFQKTCTQRVMHVVSAADNDLCQLLRFQSVR
jgi:hypothetical protein